MIITYYFFLISINHFVLLQVKKPVGLMQTIKQRKKNKFNIREQLHPLFNRACKNVPHPLILLDEQEMEKFKDNIILVDDMEQIQTINKKTIIYFIIKYQKLFK